MPQFLPNIKTKRQTQSLPYSLMNKKYSVYLHQSQLRNNNIIPAKSYLQDFKQFRQKNSKRQFQSLKKRIKTIQIRQNQNQQHQQQNMPQSQSLQKSKISKISQISSTYAKPNLYSLNKPFCIQSKIQHTLKLLQLKKKSSKIEQLHQYNITIDKSQIKSQNRYNSIEQYYKNLPKRKYKWSNQQFDKFIQILTEMNTFFKKINHVVALCLLKIGKIQVYQKKQIIQYEDDPISYFGIILWGEIFLKSKKNNHMKIFLFPGDNINEQILFKTKDIKNNIVDGYETANQTAKTKTMTAILYLKVKQYKDIYKQLVIIGQKNSIILAENIMKWSTMKKRNIKNQYFRQ